MSESSTSWWQGLSSRVRSYFEEGLWQPTVPDAPWVRAFGRRQLQVLVLTIEGIRRENILPKAYALTFIFLLALIPMLALVAAVSGGFGAKDLMVTEVKPLLTKYLMPKMGDSLFQSLMAILDKINFSSLGAVGVLGTIYTSLSALKKIEDNFNELMHAEKKRALVNRFAVYWSALTLGAPMAIFASSLQVIISRHSLTQKLLSVSFLGSWILSIVPVLLICFAFWILYLFLPSTRVHPLSALYGAVCASLVFVVATRTYFVSLAGSFQLNAIYGTLAVLPFTLVSVYIVWTIVLCGAMVTYTHQHREALLQRKIPQHLNQQAREQLACLLFWQVADNFVSGKQPPTSERLAEILGSPSEFTRETLRLWEEVGYLVQTHPDQGFIPARPLSQISIRDLLSQLRGHGPGLPKLSLQPQQQRLQSLLRKAENAYLAISALQHPIQDYLPTPSPSEEAPEASEGGAEAKQTTTQPSSLSKASA